MKVQVPPTKDTVLSRHVGVRVEAQTCHAGNRAEGARYSSNSPVLGTRMICIITLLFAS